MQTASQKKKYAMDDYVSLNRANPMIDTFTHQKFRLSCLCSDYDQHTGQTCFKCNTFVHLCLAPQPNRGQLYECFSCINKSLDPLVQVRKILVQSYFKTFPIFQYINIFNFQFYLMQEDLTHPVQVRGLVPNNTALNWPMQGAFYVNDDKNSVHQLKPLLFNSNRKHRREEYFHIPSDKLKAGKNFIRFKIPCLDKAKFTSKFQHEDRKIYYMAVNSVERLSPADLQTQTFRQRRIQKNDSIRILKSNNAEIEVISNKVCLICPYTRERIRVPVRGRYCKHFSCICLQTLIASHSHSRFWGCPICELKINQPYVDLWIYNMLKDNQKGSDVTVKEDGTYQWVKVAQNMAMDLDSDEDSPPMKVQQVPKKKQQVKAPQMLVESKQKSLSLQVPSQQSKEASRQMNIISLDDDDDILPSKQPQMKKQSLAILTKIKNKMKEATQKAAAKSVESRQTSKLDQPNKKDERAVQKPPPPNFISDIKTLDNIRQMKLQEFKKQYFKIKMNPYKRMIQTQDLKRIFKQIY